VLERCFKSPSTSRRLRTGLAGPFLDGFAKSMFAAGYASDTIRSYVWTAEHVGLWLGRRRTMITDLDEDLLARFVLHLSHGRCRGCRRGRHDRVSFRAQAFLRYLREASVVPTSAPAVARPQRVIVYAAWMRDQRGLAAATIAHSLPVAQALLGTVSDDPAQLDAACVRKFVLEYIRRHAPASAGCVTTIVRCFLRWLVMQGRCATDLTAAVPKVPTWRLARLPRYIPADDVEHILEACDRPSSVTWRDRAMLQSVWRRTAAELPLPEPGIAARRRDQAGSAARTHGWS